ncbi:MAG: glycosyltransferase family 4 protein, partial [Thermodesulfobacteriota bacterium]
MKKKIICIQTYFGHWAEHSGYHQYLKYLTGDFDIEHNRIEPGESALPEDPGMRALSESLHSKRALLPATINDILNEIYLVPKIKTLLKEHERVVVHFMDGEYGFNWFGELVKKYSIDRSRIRIVATYHQPPSILKGLVKSTERFSELDRILTVGSNQAKFFSPELAGKIRFIRHGADTDFFKPATGTKEGSDRIKCVTVGHWLRDFKVLKKVIEKSGDGVSFSIVTDSALVSDFKEDPRVTIRTGISDDELLNLYNSSDMGLMPLTDTTANNAIMEMMATGLPIVTTEVGAIRDYVDDAA